MKVQKSNFKSGCGLLLLKAIGTIAIVGLIECILGLISNKTPLGVALTPFHNHYFSFNTFYLTDTGMGSEFSESTFATTRFVIYFILGYLMYSLLNIIWLIPALKKFADRVNTVLLATVLLGAFLLAFFFPPRITVIDPINKEVRITRHTGCFIPTTVHVPFSNINTVQSGTTSDYNPYTSQYIIDLVISLTTNQGVKYSLGEIQVNEQSGSHSHAPVAIVPPAKKQLGDNVVRMIEDVVKNK